MRRLVEFGLNDGGTILLEVHETASVAGPVTRDLCDGQVTKRARQTFEDAVQRRTPRPGDHHAALRRPQAPDEVQASSALTCTPKSAPSSRPPISSPL
jgi:hypothetical protein